MRRRNLPRPALLAAAGVLVAVHAARSQVLTPAGPQFQVNESTRGFQQVPAVAALPGGGFVVVWATREAGGGDPGGVSRRQVDAAGSPVGAELRVSTFDVLPVVDPTDPSVAVAPNGSSLIVWNRSDSLLASSIRGRLYGPSGEPVGSERVISAQTLPSQSGPSVESFPGGGFVVAWDAGRYAGPRARVLDALAAPSTPEIVVEPPDSSRQRGADVAVADPQTFLVAWYGFPTSPVGGGLAGAAFSAGGDRLSPTFQIDTLGYIYYQAARPGLAPAPSGHMAVVWDEDVRTDPPFQSMLRVLAPDGSPSVEVAIDTDLVSGSSRLPAVAGASDGTFAVTWTYDRRSRDDHDDSSIRARRFDSAAQPTGVEFLVNAYTTSEQRDSVIARGADDDFLVVWRSRGSLGDDQHGDGIQARPLRIAEPPFRASLAASMTAPAGPHEPGEVVTFRLVMRNDGDPQPDRPGDELVDVLPVGLAPVVVRADTGVVAIEAGTGTVRWNGTLVSDVEIVLEIDVLIEDDAPDGAVPNQAELRFDADGDGTNEATAVSDDPAWPGSSDPTPLWIARGLVFADGFETGNGLEWPGSGDGP